jgi:hypothetical protein
MHTAALRDMSSNLNIQGFSFKASRELKKESHDVWYGPSHPLFLAVSLFEENIYYLKLIC